MVVALLTGAGAGIFGPAQTSAIRTVVPTDDLPTALSQNQAREHVAGLIGAPLGGALYAVTRWLPFAVDAVSFAVSCFTLSRLRTDLSPARTGRRTRLRADLAEGLRFVVARPFFRVLLTWAALANLVTNALFFVALLRMIEAGHGPARIGLTETAAGLGGHRRRPRRAVPDQPAGHRPADGADRLGAGATDHPADLAGQSARGGRRASSS